MSLEFTSEDYLQKKDATDDGMATLIQDLLTTQDQELEAEDSSLSAEEDSGIAEGKKRRRRRGRRHPKNDNNTATTQQKETPTVDGQSSNSTGSLTGSMCSSQQQQQQLQHATYIAPEVATLPVQYLTCSNDGKRAIPSTRNLEDMEENLTVEDMQQRNVYISGLPPLFTNKDLRELVTPFGVVKTLKCCVDHEHNDRVLLQRSAAAAAAAGLPVFTHPLSGQVVPVASVDLSTYNSAVTFTKGYGFILFYTKESAAACIKGLNDLELQDCCLKARYSETRATPFGRSSGDDKNRYISCHVDKVKERQQKEKESHERKQQQNNNSNTTATPQLLALPTQQQQPIWPTMMAAAPAQPQLQQVFFTGAMPPMPMMPQMQQPVMMMSYVNGQPMYYQQTMMMPPQMQQAIYPQMQPMTTAFYC